MKTYAEKEELLEGVSNSLTRYRSKLGFIDLNYASQDLGIDKTELKKAVLQRFWRKHQQPEPEPVAWIHRFIEHGISIGKKPVDLDKHPDRWMPVYADPTPCQTCEALARTVMMDQTSHDTPPQREWQGLTENEIKHLWYEACQTNLELTSQLIVHLARNIETKLKEKNND